MHKTIHNLKELANNYETPLVSSDPSQLMKVPLQLNCGECAHCTRTLHKKLFNADPVEKLRSNDDLVNKSELP